MRWFPLSATNTLPNESNATPQGLPKEAPVPVPSANAFVPLPASVLTRSVVGVSATYRKLKALALFVIDVVRFIRALLAPSAAMYVNEGTGVPL